MKPSKRVSSPKSARAAGVCASVSPSSVMTCAGVSARRSSTRMMPGRDVVAAQRPRRRRVAGEPEQVVALIEREPQAAGDRGEHLLRRLRTAALLEPAVVVDRHVAESGDLLAAQTRGAAPRAAPQADILRLQRLAATAEEVRQLCSVHDPSLRDRVSPQQGIRGPSSGRRRGSRRDTRTPVSCSESSQIARAASASTLQSRVQRCSAGQPARCRKPLGP